MANLIVTNGAAAVNAIARVRPIDRYLPWDDVLHAGPVPSEMSLGQLAGIRARFIWRCGWGDLESTTEKFERRNEILLSAHEEFDELVLWFEHDLYDQLQLIQILHALADHRPLLESRLPIQLICHDHFVGLSDTEILARDYRDRQALQHEHLDLGVRAWDAFTYFTPQRMETFIHDENLSDHMFLRAALRRWFEEFPNAYDGLSRTERTALAYVAKGVSDAVELFAIVQETEEAAFLGDASFWRILHQMSSNPSNLLRQVDGATYDPNSGTAGAFRLTELGEQALSGIVVESRRQLDRWMGGTHLRPGNSWYWNHVEETFQNDLVA